LLMSVGDRVLLDSVGPKRRRSRLFDPHPTKLSAQLGLEVEPVADVAVHLGDEVVDVDRKLGDGVGYGEINCSAHKWISFAGTT
jgi:hypothetical protein